MANGSYGSLDIGTNKKNIKMLCEESLSGYPVEGDEYGDPINNPDHGYTKEKSCGLEMDGSAEVGDLIMVKAGHYRFRHVAGRGSMSGFAGGLEQFAKTYGDFRFAMAGNEGGMGFTELYSLMDGHSDLGEGGQEYDDIREDHGIQRQDYEDDDGETNDKFWEDSDIAIEETIAKFGGGISEIVGYDIYTLVPHKIPTYFRCRIKKILDQE